MFYLKEYKFFSAAPVLSLTSSVSPSPNTKNLFFWLLDEKVLTRPKITTFLAKLLTKLHRPSSSNAIFQPL